MSKIITLDKHLANQIAAGEVVERPVSVIKELLENSIDAGANNITVELTNSGIDEIIITDNGRGINSDELILATQKYSTSKIKNLDDLYHIMTFGFRGEALASISSVSNFKIISKTKSSDFASSIEIKDGETSELTQCAGENGTKIIVNNLFYNTPARLNYLKTPKTEYNKISSFLQQFSLSNPHIGITFISDNKTVFTYKSEEALLTRIYTIYGSDFSENLLDIDFSYPGIHITGYISDPKVSFPNKNRQSLFVNHRIVSSPLIYRAIFNAYNRFIPHGNFPAYVLNIEVDPTQVDVNVHPRKSEVRFANESDVFRSIYNSINSKLDATTLIQNPELSQNSSDTHDFKNNLDNSTKKVPQYYTGSGTKFKSYSPYSDKTPNPSQSKIGDAQVFSRSILDNVDILQKNDDSSLEESNDLHYTPLGKIVGQMHNSYIIVETSQGMQILDQHALAERIIYEKLINSQYSSTTQGLLIGESISLTPKEVSIVEENKKVFSDMGFEFDILSHGVITIHGIPDFIKQEKIGEVFLGIVGDIGEENFSKSTTLEEVRNKIFAYTSCRSAIKFGNKLNLFEMNKLLHDAVLDYSATCPHGRPVIYSINLEDLQNKYER